MKLLVVRLWPNSEAPGMQMNGRCRVAGAPIGGLPAAVGNHRAGYPPPFSCLDLRSLRDLQGIFELDTEVARCSTTWSTLAGVIHCPK